jgi:hypothetical protein
MEITGTIIEVGLDTTVDLSIATIQTEVAVFQIAVSKFMAQALAHKLYQKVSLILQDPILVSDGKATATFINTRTVTNFDEPTTAAMAG